MPDESEVLALVALMLLNDARRHARVRHGEFVRLDDQDRSLWDEEEHSEGRRLLERALSLGGGGPYVLQAAIAELHLGEPRDWEQIAALYSALQGLMGSPVVELNRAVAVAEVEGPAAALALLEGLPLEDYRYFHSTRADLLRRAGRDEEAQRAYERALELSQTEPERRFLEGRVAALRRPPSE